MSAKDYFKEGFRAFRSKMKEVFITIPKDFFKGNWNKLKERRRRKIKGYGRFGLLSKRLSKFFLLPTMVFEIIILLIGVYTPNGNGNFKDPIWIYWTFIGVGIFFGIMFIFFIILQFFVYGEKKDRRGLVEINYN